MIKAHIYIYVYLFIYIHSFIYLFIYTYIYHILVLKKLDFRRSGNPETGRCVPGHVSIHTLRELGRCSIDLTVVAEGQHRLAKRVWGYINIIL